MKLGSGNRPAVGEPSGFTEVRLVEVLHPQIIQESRSPVGRYWPIADLSTSPG